MILGCELEVCQRDDDEGGDDGEEDEGEEEDAVERVDLVAGKGRGGGEDVDVKPYAAPCAAAAPLILARTLCPHTDAKM